LLSRRRAVAASHLPECNRPAEGSRNPGLRLLLPEAARPAEQPLVRLRGGGRRRGPPPSHAQAVGGRQVAVAAVAGPGPLELATAGAPAQPAEARGPHRHKQLLPTAENSGCDALASAAARQAPSSPPTNMRPPERAGCRDAAAAVHRPLPSFGTELLQPTCGLPCRCSPLLPRSHSHACPSLPLAPCPFLPPQQKSVEEAEEVAAAAWEPAEGTSFQVRSHNYMRSKVKEPSGPCIYRREQGCGWRGWVGWQALCALHIQGRAGAAGERGGRIFGAGSSSGSACLPSRGGLAPTLRLLRRLSLTPPAAPHPSPDTLATTCPRLSAPHQSGLQCASPAHRPTRTRPHRSPACRLIGVDVYTFDFKIYHIAQHVTLPPAPVLGPGAAELPADQALPPLLIINMQLPTYPPSLFGCNDGHGHSLVYYFALPEGWEPSQVRRMHAGTVSPCRRRLRSFGRHAPAPASPPWCCTKPAPHEHPPTTFHTGPSPTRPPSLPLRCAPPWAPQAATLHKTHCLFPLPPQTHTHATPLVQPYPPPDGQPGGAGAGAALHAQQARGRRLPHPRSLQAHPAHCERGRVGGEGAPVRCVCVVVCVCVCVCGGGGGDTKKTPHREN
jgi:hypothetical protein